MTDEDEESIDEAKEGRMKQGKETALMDATDVNAELARDLGQTIGLPLAGSKIGSTTRSRCSYYRSITKERKTICSSLRAELIGSQQAEKPPLSKAIYFDSRVPGGTFRYRFVRGYFPFHDNYGGRPCVHSPPRRAQFQGFPHFGPFPRK